MRPAAVATSVSVPFRQPISYAELIVRLREPRCDDYLPHMLRFFREMPLDDVLVCIDAGDVDALQLAGALRYYGAQDRIDRPELEAWLGSICSAAPMRRTQHACTCCRSASAMKRPR